MINNKTSVMVKRRFSISHKAINSEGELVPLQTVEYDNPFSSLLDLVTYYYSLADKHDMEALRCFADCKTLKNNKYPKIIQNYYMDEIICNLFWASIHPAPKDPWMNFDNEQLEKLLEDDFFWEYHNTIYYEGKIMPCSKGLTGPLKSFVNSRKYTLLEVYTYAKLQSIAAMILPREQTYRINEFWCFQDMIEQFMDLQWYNLIADVYKVQGKYWFSNGADQDPVLFKWACYAIEACKRTQKVEDGQLKKDLMDIYSELLISSVRRDSLEQNKEYLNYIKACVADFDVLHIETLSNKMQKLKYENEKLSNNNVSLEKSMQILRTKIHDLQNDDSRDDMDRVEAIAHHIYAMMPEDNYLDKSVHRFSDIWNDFSDATKKDIKTAMKIYTSCHSIDLALFLMLCSLEREFNINFFMPFWESSYFVNRETDYCNNTSYKKTHEALTNKKNVHPTIGNIPFIGRAISNPKAIQSSNLISAFSQFLGNQRKKFTEICNALDTYRVGVKRYKVVEIRNGIAHGNESVKNDCDETCYEEITRFLYEPPLKIMFMVIIYSKSRKK